MRLSNFITIVICFLACGLIYTQQNYKCDLKISKIRQMSLEKTLALEERLRDYKVSTEIETEALIQDYEKKLLDIDNQHKLISSELMFSNNSYSNASAKVSSATEITSQPKSISANQCAKDGTISAYKQANKRLSLELVNLAKSKDELAIKYNTLLDLYKKQESQIKSYIIESNNNVTSL